MNQEHSDNDEIRRLEEQFRLNPDGLVFARLADAYRRAGDPLRALEVLEAGISRHRDYATAHLVRARTYMDLERSGDAEQALLRVLEVDGNNLVAMRGLAGLSRARGDDADARAWLERISGIDAGATDELVSPQADATEAEQLTPTEEDWWKAGQEGPAGAWWFEDPAEDTSPEDGDLLTRTMAELYEKQGLMEEAAAIYRELLRDHPEDEELRASLTRLEAVSPPRDVDPPADEVVPDSPASKPRTPGRGAPSGNGEVFLEWLRGLGQ